MTVAVFYFFGQTPFKPSLLIVLATVLRLMVSPSSMRIGQDLWGPRHFVRFAMKPRHLLLDPLGADRPFRRDSLAPGIETWPRNFEQSGHPFHAVVTLLREHQCERFSFVSAASRAKRRDAFLEKPDPPSTQNSPCAAAPTRPAQSHSKRHPGLLAGLDEGVHPPAQRLLGHPELTSNPRHRTANVDHQHYRLTSTNSTPRRPMLSQRDPLDNYILNGQYESQR